MRLSRALFSCALVIVCLGQVSAQTVLSNHANTTGRVFPSSYDYYVYRPTYASSSAFFALKIYIYASAVVDLYVGNNYQPSGGSFSYFTTTAAGTGLVTIPVSSIPYSVYLSVYGADDTEVDYQVYIDEKGPPNSRLGTVSTFDWILNYNYSATVRWTCTNPTPSDLVTIRLMNYYSSQSVGVIASGVPNTLSYTFNPAALNFSVSLTYYFLRVEFVDNPENYAYSYAFYPARASAIIASLSTVTVGTAVRLSIISRSNQYNLDLVDSSGRVLQMITRNAVGSTYNWVPSFDLNTTAPLTAQLSLWAPASNLAATNFTTAPFTVRPWNPGSFVYIAMESSLTFPETYYSTINAYTLAPRGYQMRLRFDTSSTTSHYYVVSVSSSDPTFASYQYYVYSYSQTTLPFTNDDTVSQQRLYFFQIRVMTSGSTPFTFTVDAAHNLGPILSPSSGVTWSFDRPQLVEWINSGMDPNERVNITLNVNSAVSLPLATFVPNSGSCLVDFQTLLFNKSLPQIYYTISVVLARSKSVYATSSTFIPVGPITLLSPRSGQLAYGKPINVQLRASSVGQYAAVDLVDSTNTSLVLQSAYNLYLYGYSYVSFDYLFSTMWTPQAGSTSTVKAKLRVSYTNTEFPSLPVYSDELTITPPDLSTYVKMESSVTYERTQTTANPSTYFYLSVPAGYYANVYFKAGQSYSSYVGYLYCSQRDMTVTQYDDYTWAYGTSENLIQLRNTYGITPLLFFCRTQISTVSSVILDTRMVLVPPNYHLSIVPSSFHPGDSVTITWNAYSANSTVYLKFFDASNVMTALAAAAPDIGSFTFIAPRVEPGLSRITMQSNDPLGFGSTSYYVTVLSKYAVISPTSTTTWYLNSSTSGTVKFSTGLTPGLSSYYTITLNSITAGISMTLYQGYLQDSYGVISYTASVADLDSADDYRVTIRNSTSGTLVSDFFSVRAASVTDMTLDTALSLTCPYNQLVYVRTPLLSAALEGFLLTVSVSTPSIPSWAFAYYLYEHVGRSLPVSYDRNTHYLYGPTGSATITIPTLKASGDSITMGLQAGYATSTPTISLSFSRPAYATAVMANFKINTVLSSLQSQYGSNEGIITQLDKEVSNLLSLPRGLVSKGYDPYNYYSYTTLQVVLLPSWTLSVADAQKLTRSFSSSSLYSNLSAAMPRVTYNYLEYPLLSQTTLTVYSYGVSVSMCSDQTFAYSCYTPYTPPTYPRSRGLSASAIAGIISGATLGLIFLAVCVVRLKRARQLRALNAVPHQRLPEEGFAIPPGGFMVPAGEPGPRHNGEMPHAQAVAHPHAVHMGHEGVEGEPVYDEGPVRVHGPSYFFAPVAPPNYGQQGEVYQPVMNSPMPFLHQQQQPLPYAYPPPGPAPAYIAPPVAANPAPVPKEKRGARPIDDDDYKVDIRAKLVDANDDDHQAQIGGLPYQPPVVPLPPAYDAAALVAVEDEAEPAAEGDQVGLLADAAGVADAEAEVREPEPDQAQ